MDAFFITYLMYPDTGPVKFLFWMLAVITLGIWWGMREDK